MDAPAIGPPPLPATSEPMSVALPAYDPAQNDKGNVHAFDDQDGPSFSDVLDIINPLQHIPIINTIYQNLTGDSQGAVASVIGGALWGGPIGLGCAVADLAVQDSTGKNVGDNVVALFSDDSSTTQLAKQAQPEKKTAVAAAAPKTDDTAPPPPAAAPVHAVTATPLTPGGTTSRAPQASSKTDTINPAITDGPVRAGDYLVFGGGPIAAATGTPLTLAAANTNTTNVSSTRIKAGIFLPGDFFSELSMRASQHELKKYQPEQHGVEDKKAGIHNSGESRLYISVSNQSPGEQCQKNAHNNAK